MPILLGSLEMKILLGGKVQLSQRRCVHYLSQVAPISLGNIKVATVPFRANVQQSQLLRLHPVPILLGYLDVAPVPLGAIVHLSKCLRLHPVPISLGGPMGERVRGARTRHRRWDIMDRGNTYER